MFRFDEHLERYGQNLTRNGHQSSCEGPLLLSHCDHNWNREFVLKPPKPNLTQIHLMVLVLFPASIQKEGMTGGATLISSPQDGQ
jgi:hypothetical protein